MTEYDVIMHHGVRGMKWGVHHNVTTTGAISAHKASSKKVAKLSNDVKLQKRSDGSYQSQYGNVYNKEADGYHETKGSKLVTRHERVQKAAEVGATVAVGAAVLGGLPKGMEAAHLAKSALAGGRMTKSQVAKGSASMIKRGIKEGAKSQLKPTNLGLSVAQTAWTHRQSKTAKNYKFDENGNFINKQTEAKDNAQYTKLTSKAEQPGTSDAKFKRINKKIDKLTRKGQPTSKAIAKSIKKESKIKHDDSSNEMAEGMYDSVLKSPVEMSFVAKHPQVIANALKKAKKSYK